MDTGWARMRLVRFEAEAARCLEVGRVEGGPTSTEAGRHLARLREDEYTVKEILRRLNPDLATFNLDGWGGVGTARAQVQRGMGALDDLAELTEHLGPEGPSIAADSLHPWVWEAAQPLWASRHYRQSVAAAAGVVSAQLQAKLDRYDMNDAALVVQAFSPDNPQPGRPRLRLPGHDDTARSRQEGAVSYGRSCFAVIRNPAVHEVEEWPEPLALERLAAFSVLARLIDDSEVTRADGGR